MGNIYGAGFSLFGINFWFVSAKLTSVSWIVVGLIVVCTLLVLGFYIYKHFSNDGSETEDIRLGGKKGFIRRRYDE
jgi:uncharacterized membrane protein YukC